MMEENKKLKNEIESLKTEYENTIDEVFEDNKKLAKEIEKMKNERNIDQVEVHTEEEKKRLKEKLEFAHLV